MYLMLQQDAPDDYVIAHRETRSIREFLTRHSGTSAWMGTLRRDRSPVDAPGLTCSCSAVMPQGRTNWAGPRTTASSNVAQMTEADCTWRGVDIAGMRRKARREEVAGLPA